MVICHAMLPPCFDSVFQSLKDTNGWKICYQSSFSTHTSFLFCWFMKYSQIPKAKTHKLFELYHFFAIWVRSQNLGCTFPRNSVNSFFFGLWREERLRERQRNATVRNERNVLCTRSTYLRGPTQYLVCYPLPKPAHPRVAYLLPMYSRYNNRKKRTTTVSTPTHTLFGATRAGDASLL